MLLFSTLLAFAVQSSGAEATVAEPPRLVVVIGVDQMIPEQLDRLAPYLEGGFGRFVRDGFSYRNAMLEHANTETGPGYATLGTGCHPRTSGIVSNDWFNADGSGSVYCVEDREATHVLGSGHVASSSRGVSPRNFRVRGLGDWLKVSDPESMVVSLAGKDRAAVGMGGQKPDLCLWWNRQIGGFTTTNWYAEQLPEWVESFNAGLTSYIFDGPWGDGWSPELPTGIESAGTAPDEREGETSRGYVNGLLRTGQSDESLQRGRMLGDAAYRSPIGDQLTLEIAQFAVAKLDLGADEHPDLLFLGLSGCDVVGHGYGPYSTEVTDLLLRTDRSLEQLFRQLDETIGADQWSAVLTADHGVLMLPEEAQNRGIESRRFGSASEDYQRARDHSIETFGEDFIAMIGGRGIRLDLEGLQAAGIDAAEVRSSLATVMRDAEWMERVFTLEELAGGAAEKDPWLYLAQQCFDAERSPDVVFQRRPWSLVNMTTGTSHGSPYPYDRRVPLVFLGPGIAPNARFDAASTADVAPTILNLLQIAVPDEMDGKVLDLR